MLMSFSNKCDVFKRIYIIRTQKKKLGYQLKQIGEQTKK